MAEPIGAGSDGGVRDSRTREGMVSVVVITHNERDRIGACLESVFDACADLDRFEVVLVDSRSTDGTVEVAQEYPITVLQLPEEPVVTPSAGRYVGTAATSGDLVLFVDGDMILEDGWLESACRRVREQADLGGVDGHLNESTAEGDTPIDALRGVVLYDRAALEDAGGFDPHVQAMEDIDLSYRLAADGYRLVRLADVVARHPSREETDRVRRWKNGYYHGRGELFRKYLSSPDLFARLVYRTRLHLVSLAWFSMAPIAAALGGRKGLLAWAGGSVAGFAGVSRRQGTDWTVDKLAGLGPVVAGIALGFPGRHREPIKYPLENVATLQTAPPETGTEAVRAT